MGCQVIRAGIPPNRRKVFMHSTKRATLWLAIALCLALSPMSAYAADASVHAGSTEANPVAADSNEAVSEGSAESSADDSSAAEEDAKRLQDEKQLQAEKEQREEVQANLKEEFEQNEAEKQEKTEKQAKKDKKAEKGNQAKKQSKKAKSGKAQRVKMVLEYDRSAIDQIGTQEQTGHTICCPSFSCAYGDAVIDGTINDHSYYTCSCCTWNDWGAGASVDRQVGSSEVLLREAYDQISDGKPTVIHVAGYGSGEHWICLIGYKNAENPDSLSLDNFIALDPWDGAEITASERYSLYGDGCEHISSR